MSDLDLLTHLALAGTFVILTLSLWKIRTPKAVIFGNIKYKMQYSKHRMIEDIKSLSDYHETAAVLTELIHKDGAGSWPPRANHTHSTWPKALQPYKEIYLQLAPLLPRPVPSLDDDVNRAQISKFRSLFGKLLCERIDLVQVKQLLAAADAGQWDVFPRDTYNAFYCCIASSRHAYRWATIPVVKVAQLENVVSLPAELDEPWAYLQNHFGCVSSSGNNTSNLLLNFDVNGKHIFLINTGMSHSITSSEEAFSQIFYDVEMLGLPIYHDMVLATIAFTRGDKTTCLKHMAHIAAQLRPLLSSYYDRMHDQKIARSVWLSRVQGFFAWGIGHVDKTSGEWAKFDGLSGNQVMLFQALDAFLGLEPYLSSRDQERNVPIRQRALCKAFKKHSFRALLDETSKDETEAQIAREFSEILKRLRVFRTAHRTRAKAYLSQPAPERLPMTAGKSLLKSDTNESLQFLDEFMVRRLAQTV
ncbi:hypothetical protein F5B20DRAFT_567796 [Whalleya microplaca]|nr:hypothetical protein F5B20DRAFT_567796 [Whalleya microplaca]